MAALLGLGDRMHGGGLHPLRRAGVDLQRQRQPVGAGEADPMDRGQRVGVCADRLGGLAPVHRHQLGDVAGEPMRREQRVQTPLRAPLDPVVGRLAGPHRPDAAELAEGGLRIAVDRLEHRLSMPVDQLCRPRGADSRDRLQVLPGALDPGRVERFGLADPQLQAVLGVLLEEPRRRARAPSSRWPSEPTAASGEPSSSETSATTKAPSSELKRTFSTRTSPVEGIAGRRVDARQRLLSGLDAHRSKVAGSAAHLSPVGRREVWSRHRPRRLSP